MVVDSAINSARAIADWSFKWQFLRINSLIVRLASKASRRWYKPSFSMLLLLKLIDLNDRLWIKALARNAAPLAVIWFESRLNLEREFSSWWFSSYWLSCDAKYETPLSWSEFDRKSRTCKNLLVFRIISLIAILSSVEIPERKYCFSSKWNEIVNFSVRKWMSIVVDVALTRHSRFQMLWWTTFYYGKLFWSWKIVEIEF